MVHLEITNGSTRVQYGFDHVTGVFLLVQDTRLASESDNELDQVATSVCESGDGTFLSSHTGEIGIGLRVAPRVMAEYLKRFGVPEPHIRRLLRKHEVGYCDDCYRSIAPCFVCDSVLDSMDPPESTNPGGMVCATCSNTTQELLHRCSSCRGVFYCCKECQRADWEVHKLFCKLEEPPPLEDKKFVRGLLFPVNETRPRMVQVPLAWDEDDGAFFSCAESFENGQLDRVGKYDQYENQNLGYVLTLHARDGFLVDGSPINQCVQAISKGYTTMRGPLLMVKRKSVKGDFVNISVSDTPTITRFLSSVFS